MGREGRNNAAREHLNQIGKLTLQIDQRRRERERLFLDAMCNGSPSLSADKVQSSISGDPMGDRLALCADLTKEIDRLIDSMIAERHRIIGEIQSLPTKRHVELLYLKYVDGKSLTQCADIMVKSNGEPYSYDHIASMHGTALQEFDEIILKSHRNPI